MRKLCWLLAALCMLAALTITACGNPNHTPRPAPTPRAAVPAPCGNLAAGHGAPGLCGPRAALGLLSPHPFAAFGLPTFPDLSNNDPCVCGPTLRNQGYVGLIVKANEGTYYVDPWAAPMAASAHAAGLAIGAYDFDVYYSVAEARLFVSRLHALGIYPNTPHTFPPYLDVEAGNFNYGGLLAQIAYLHQQGYSRVGIYTGDWYWGPHAGCRWPQGVSAWLSGYPNAPVPCGTTGYNAHQFTSSPIDLTVFLGSLAQFRAFTNGGPAPDPYAKYPNVVFALAFGQRGNEHKTVSLWDAAACENPVRRQVCQSTLYHLKLERDRDIWVAFHKLTAHGWVAIRRPRWAESNLGARVQGLQHRITAPTGRRCTAARCG